MRTAQMGSRIGVVIVIVITTAAKVAHVPHFKSGRMRRIHSGALVFPPDAGKLFDCAHGRDITTLPLVTRTKGFCCREGLDVASWLAFASAGAMT